MPGLVHMISGNSGENRQHNQTQPAPQDGKWQTYLTSPIERKVSIIPNLMIFVPNKTTKRLNSRNSCGAQKNLHRHARI